MRPFTFHCAVAPVLVASSPVLDSIVADLPIDPASATVLLLLLGSAFAAVWFGRSKGPPP